MVILGVINAMKNATRHNHTYHNGTKLTLSATKRGLRIYWKGELNGKRHPLVYDPVELG
jgi:hypothetical protein